MTQKKIYIGVDPSIQQGKCGYCRVEDGVIKVCEGWGIGEVIREIIHLNMEPSNQVKVYWEDANCRGGNYKEGATTVEEKRQGAGIIKGACATAILTLRAFNVDIINNFWGRLVPYSKHKNKFAWKQIVGWHSGKHVPDEHCRMAALLVSHHINVKPILLVPKKAKV